MGCLQRLVVWTTWLIAWFKFWLQGLEGTNKWGTYACIPQIPTEWKKKGFQYDHVPFRGSFSLSLFPSYSASLSGEQMLFLTIRNKTKRKQLKKERKKREKINWRNNEASNNNYQLYSLVKKIFTVHTCLYKGFLSLEETNINYMTLNFLSQELILYKT